MSAALDGRGSGSDQQMTVAGERLGAVGHAAVLQHRARVVDRHVRRIGEGHFVPVDLHDPAHSKYLFDRPLFRVQFVEPAQVVRNPYAIRLVLGPAAATGAVRFQLGQLGPDVRVVVLLVQAPDHCDRLITGMWDRKVLDFHLYSGTVYVYIDKDVFLVRWSSRVTATLQDNVKILRYSKILMVCTKCTIRLYEYCYTTK